MEHPTVYAYARRQAPHVHPRLRVGIRQEIFKKKTFIFHSYSSPTPGTSASATKK
jgi:hypothetical protein